MNEYFHGWGMGFGWIVPILLILLILYILQGRDEKREEEKSDAQAILDRRFATGEISKEEYEARTRLLKKNGEKK